MQIALVIMTIVVIKSFKMFSSFVLLVIVSSLLVSCFFARAELQSGSAMSDMMRSGTALLQTVSKMVRFVSDILLRVLCLYIVAFACFAAKVLVCFCARTVAKTARRAVKVWCLVGCRLRRSAAVCLVLFVENSRWFVKSVVALLKRIKPLVRFEALRRNLIVRVALVLQATAKCFAFQRHLRGVFEGFFVVFVIFKVPSKVVSVLVSVLCDVWDRCCSLFVAPQQEIVKASIVVPVPRRHLSCEPRKGARVRFASGSKLEQRVMIPHWSSMSVEERRAYYSSKKEVLAMRQKYDDDRRRGVLGRCFVMIRTSFRNFFRAACCLVLCAAALVRVCFPFKMQEWKEPVLWLVELVSCVLLCLLIASVLVCIFYLAASLAWDLLQDAMFFIRWLMRGKGDKPCILDANQCTEEEEEEEEVESEKDEEASEEEGSEDEEKETEEEEEASEEEEEEEASEEALIVVPRRRFGREPLKGARVHFATESEVRFFIPDRDEEEAETEEEDAFEEESSEEEEEASEEEDEETEEEEALVVVPRRRFGREPLKGARVHFATESEVRFFIPDRDEEEAETEEEDAFEEESSEEEEEASEEEDEETEEEEALVVVPRRRFGREPLKGARVHFATEFEVRTFIPDRDTVEGGEEEDEEMEDEGEAVYDDDDEKEEDGRQDEVEEGETEEMEVEMLVEKVVAAAHLPVSRRRTKKAKAFGPCIRSRLYLKRKCKENVRYTR